MGKVVTYKASGDELHRLAVAADTLDEATIQTGHGVYAVFRLFEGLRVFRLDAQLDRMRRSASLLGQPFPLTNDWMRWAIRSAVIESGIELPRIRITVPHDDNRIAYISVEPFAQPEAVLYERGVKVGLTQHARSTARAKDSRFIEARHGLETGDVYEVMMMDADERILEGTSSNFYAVLNGILRTADEGVLAGIARSVLLDVAGGILPVDLRPVNRVDLPSLSEAMLTSSSRGIIPIVQIDDIRIGDGTPGAAYRRLSEAYKARITSELESV